MKRREGELDRRSTGPRSHFVDQSLEFHQPLGLVDRCRELANDPPDSVEIEFILVKCEKFSNVSSVACMHDAPLAGPRNSPTAGAGSTDDNAPTVSERPGQSRG